MIARQQRRTTMGCDAVLRDAVARAGARGGARARGGGARGGAAAAAGGGAARCLLSSDLSPAALIGRERGLALAGPASRQNSATV
jgi:hypothetical protein